MKRIESYCLWMLVLLACWVTTLGVPQGTAVTGRVTLLAPNGSPRTDKNAGIVVWLTPSNPVAAAARARNSPARQVLNQKDKRFDKRVMAIEVGTTVDFPNRDPFFHNVFSQFDGERFDLGLYEAGASKHIQFRKAGVCYLFCNIHSQMSAVIVVVDTPYFALLETPGEFRIPDVPAGRYQFNVWAERPSPEALKQASRTVTVEAGSVNVGSIQLQESRGRISVHSNKYGTDYEKPVFSSPIYIQP